MNIGLLFLLILHTQESPLTVTSVVPGIELRGPICRMSLRRVSIEGNYRRAFSLSSNQIVFTYGEPDSYQSEILDFSDGDKWIRAVVPDSEIYIHAGTVTTNSGLAQYSIRLLDSDPADRILRIRVEAGFQSPAREWIVNIGFLEDLPDAELSVDGKYLFVRVGLQYRLYSLADDEPSLLGSFGSAMHIQSAHFVSNSGWAFQQDTLSNERDAAGRRVFKRTGLYQSEWGLQVEIPNLAYGNWTNAFGRDGFWIVKEELPRQISLFEVVPGTERFRITFRLIFRDRVQYFNLGTRYGVISTSKHLFHVRAWDLTK